MTSRDTPSFLRRLGRATLTLTVTGTVMAGAGFAVIFGLGILNERATAAEPPAAADIVPVSVRPILIEDGYTMERRFIGQIESRQSVDLSFELTGKLVEILVDEGDRVEEGQEIARLDTDLLIADRDRLLAGRDALAAQLEFAEREVIRNSKLSETGFASDQRVDQARANRDELRARIAETEASLASVEIRLRKSHLRAPFTGTVAAQSVDGGETLAAGQHVLRLVDDGATKVRVGLPLETDLANLETATVQIGIERFTARLDSVRPDIDPITRTRTVILSIDHDAGMALGRTATVILDDHVSATGAWVPLDAVSEGRGSLWSVLVVDDAHTVRSAAVEILHAESDRLFVRGTFKDGTPLIQSGPQRITPGQTVRVVTGG